MDEMATSRLGRDECRRRLELQVQAQRGHYYRSAVPVVAGIVDVLHSGRHVDSAPNVRRVVGLDGVLPPVIQLAITQEETKPAVRQIDLVIFLDPVRYKGYPGSVLLAMPPRAIHRHALRDRQIDFGVGKGLGLSVVPSPTGKRGDVPREILFQVGAKTILAGDVPGMVRDIWRRDQPGLKLGDRISVDAHVGVVGVGQQPDHSAFLRHYAVTQFIFPILRMSLPRLPYQVDSVRDLRHEPFGEAKTPVAVLVIHHESHGVTASIGGVVPGAAVVDRPVHELKMRVRPNGILIEEIGHAELAEANLQAAARQLVKQRKKIPLVLNLILAQSEYFVDHAAPEVRRFAQRRIAHDVQVGIAGQSQAGAQRRAAGFFDIHQDLGGIVEPHAGVKRHHARRGFLIARAEAVLSAVGSVKVRVSLEDEIRLAGEPEARVLEMREHRFGIVIGGRAGRIVRRRRRRLSLSLRRLLRPQARRHERESTQHRADRQNEWKG